MGPAAVDPGSVFVVGQHDVPTIQAVLTPVEDDVAGLPALLGFETAEVAPAATVDNTRCSGERPHAAP